MTAASVSVSPIEPCLVDPVGYLLLVSLTPQTPAINNLGFLRLVLGRVEHFAEAFPGTLLPPCAESWASNLEDERMNRKWPEACWIKSA